jgi:ABC-type sugar transport system ATPase subunit
MAPRDDLSRIPSVAAGPEHEVRDVVALSVAGVSKTFGVTRVLDQMSLDIEQGEIHALVGQNGSGKSTFIKILAGYHRPDTSTMAALSGVPFEVGHHVPDDLRFVHQDLGLVLDLNAMDNLALRGGFARGFGRRIRWREQEERTRSILDRLGIGLDIHRPLAEATPVERTMVAVAGALQGWRSGRGVLVLDEPSAVLPIEEVARLFAVIRAIRETGTSVLYVSHRLDEIFEIADRVTVLREGRKVATRRADTLDADSLAGLMVGEQVDTGYRAAQQALVGAPIVIEARNLRGRWLRGVDLTVFKGEILGIAGLSGAGVLELPYVMAGLASDASGQVRVPAQSEKWVDVKHAAKFGIPIVPADRAREAVIAEFSVRENLTLSVLDRLGSARLRASVEDRLVSNWAGRLNIVAPSFDAEISTLSGGNQQKVILARCLARDPDLLILCEPTAGVDIGTRIALYQIVAELAENGLTVIVASSDENDLVAMCTRVLVLRAGRIVDELGTQSLEHSAILRSMVEGDGDAAA